MKNGNIKKWFLKVNLSNWIALASLVISIIALVFTCIPNKAKIEYEFLPEFKYSITVDTTQVTITVVRLVLKNNGDKPVTVERLIKKEKNKGITGFTNVGESRNIERNITLKQIKKKLFSKYFFEEDNDSLLYFDLTNGLIINEKIEPGENLQINFLLTQYGPYLEDIESIAFDETIVLSDNQLLPIYFEFDAKIRRTGR